MRNWVLDGYGGVSFHTTYTVFYSLPNPQPQSQSPIGSFKGHLSYDFNKLHDYSCMFSLVPRDSWRLPRS